MNETENKPFVPKTPMDFQRLKLERLMANPEKPVVIPEAPKEKKGGSVPEFIRNVMGSSAGAGSGEFHVYRHLRRKEYTRQKLIEEKAEKERQNDEYLMKLEENKRKMEERTEKKRAKRLKKKMRKKERLKNVKQNAKKEQTKESSDEDSSCEKSSEDDGNKRSEKISETADSSDVTNSKDNERTDSSEFPLQ